MFALLNMCMWIWCCISCISVQIIMYRNNSVLFNNVYLVCSVVVYMFISPKWFIMLFVFVYCLF